MNKLQSQMYRSGAAMMDSTTNREPGMLNVLDQSILLREWRRWRQSSRWMLLVVILLIGAGMSVVLVPSVLLAPAAEERVLLSALIGFLMASGSAIAFFQSIQVLRQENWSQTLEGLFLTLQRSRGVILSVVVSGFAAGIVVPLLFLPVVLFAAEVLEVPPGISLLAIVTGAAVLMLSASFGALWFFIGQQLTPIRSGGIRWTLNFLGCLTVVAFGASIHPANTDSGAAAAFLLYLVIGAAVWSLRTLCEEASDVRRGRIRESADPASRLMRWLPLGAAVLMGLLFFGLVAMLNSDGGTADPILWPRPLLSLSPLPLLDAIARGDRSAEGAAAPGSSLFLLAVPALLSMLLGMAFTVSSCRLYRRLRQSPELASPQASAALTVVEVGRDDWRGFKNPILTRELRTRLRSGDARMFLVIATAASAAACLAPMLGSIGSDLSPVGLAALARSSFLAVSLTQFGILWLLGPGIGAEVVASEREKKTYEMLLASRLTGAQIYWGKVLGLAALLALLVSPALPLLALAALLHGVTMWAAALMIGVVGLFVCGISLTSVAISTLVRSSVNGKWIAYLAGLFSLCLFGEIPVILCSGTPAMILIPFLLLGGLLFSVLAFPAILRLEGPRRPAHWPAYPTAVPGTQTIHRP